MENVRNEEDFVETLELSTDAEIEEARNLQKDVVEKHRRTRRKLDERFNKSRQESSKASLDEQKKRISSTLDEPSTTGEINIGKTKGERRKKKPKTVDDEEKLTKEKGRQKSQKSKEETEESVDDIVAQKVVGTESQEAAPPQEEKLKPKRIDRAAIAAALREKRKREKEAEQTIESSREPDTEEGGALKDSYDKRLSTRFDTDLLSSKGYTVAAEPEITWEMLKQQETITDRQAFDFFCQKWPDHPQKTVKERVAETSEGEDREVAEDERQLIDSEETPYTIKSSLLFVESKPAEMAPTYERINKEEEIGYLYVPGDVDLSFLEQRPLRNLEEEGFFVGRRPYINSLNERRLESRITKEQQYDWFGEDGRIIILPDPLKEIPYRPLMWDEQFNPIPDHLRTEHWKPVIISNNYETVDLADANNTFEMIINIDSIEFVHHHLFSVEHVYAQRLKQLFSAYNYINQQESLEFFEQRILSLKHAISHLQERLRVHEINNNIAGIEEVSQRLSNYRQEIRNTRMARNNEEAYLRKLITSIIKTWKQIRNERSRTNMVLTNVVIKIKRIESSVEEDTRNLEKDIVEQMEEEKEFFEENYRNGLALYKENRGKYENQQAMKKSARDRQTVRDQRNENSKQQVDQDEEDKFQEKKDLEILSEQDLERPVTPEPFNQELVYNQIKSSIDASRRLPGEPHIIPVLKIGPISENVIDRNEINRRNMVLQYQYYIELYFNRKKVITTPMKHLSQDFVLTFCETIPIIVSQYPELIDLKLYEKQGMSSKLLTNVSLDVPPPKVSAEVEDMDVYNFRTDQFLIHKTCGVGSGEHSFQLESIDGTPSGEIISPLFTSGIVYAKAYWAVDAEGVLKIPQSYLNSEKFKNQHHSRDPLMALGLNKILEFQRRQEWKNVESHLDPNDPRDAKVIKALHTHDKLGVDPETKMSADYFRLDPYMDEFDFATDDDIDRSLRFKMIVFRNMNVPEFRTLAIPPSDDKVPLELIKEYESRKSQARKKVAVTGFEARLLQHQEYIEKIRDDVMLKFKDSLLKKSLTEMVREEEIPTISDIFPKLLDLSRFNRPLQPISEPRKQVPVHNIYEMDVEIIVVIQRATNLPIDITRKTVMPFAQVHFQGYSKHTDVLEGPNPAWDTELRIPFKPPTSITSLDAVKDAIIISIFDQQVININDKAFNKATTTHERYERHWLGSLEIPFNTIYLNSRIEGNFRLKQPAFIQGYESIENYDNTDSMLSVFITLDPEIHPPQPMKERFFSMEDPKVLVHIDRWYDSIKAKFPKRFRRATVVNMRCQEILVNRYISSLAPPEELLEGEDINIKAQTIARYVALIPFMADAMVFPGISDIWSTCDLFLKMLIGDEEEHAVLLCNYFIKLYNDPDRVFLCLGQAIPEGATSYVLVRDGNNDIWLWNSSTATKYRATDTTCPMFSLEMLVSAKNVWANFQSNTRPSDLSYDLSNKKLWCPLFTTNPLLPTIQPDAIIYQPPYLKEVEDFQINLETQLRNSIMDWRLGHQTHFVLGFRREMINVLATLESNCGKMTDEIKDKLKKITKGYKVFGFPINLPYMDISDILTRVESTGIHLTADPLVEFTIAVYIKAYANTVLSIWIYVASMTRD